MVVSCYYNRENDVLLVATTNKYVTKDVVDNVVVLKDDEGSVVGLNIFQPQGKLNDGLNDVNLIGDMVKPYFSEDLLNPFVVGYVEKRENHPSSEKLNVCQINLGDETKQIICGASNIDEEMKVVVARVGAVMPNGMSILPSKLLKVDSFGMVCSGKELNKEQDYPGIMVLDDKYEIGQEII